jgi:hypothetical protein
MNTLAWLKRVLALLVYSLIGSLWLAVVWAADTAMNDTVPETAVRTAAHAAPVAPAASSARGA